MWLTVLLGAVLLFFIWELLIPHCPQRMKPGRDKITVRQKGQAIPSVLPSRLLVFDTGLVEMLTHTLLTVTNSVRFVKQANVVKYNTQNMLSCRRLIYFLNRVFCHFEKNNFEVLPPCIIETTYQRPSNKRSQVFKLQDFYYMDFDMGFWNCVFV